MIADHTTSPPRWNSSELPYSSSSFLQNDFPMNRFVGDGLDYRRPVMSQPSTDVIDLTEESSTPRTNRAPTRGVISTSIPRRSGRPEHPIIDLEEEYGDDGPDIQSEHTRDASPEFEVLYSRPLSAARPRSQSSGARRDGSQSRLLGRPVTQSTIQRSVASIHRGLQEATNRIGFYQSMLRPAPQASGHHHHHHQGHHHHQAARHRVPNEADLLFLQDVGLDFNLPDQLDFETQGFRMGDVAQPRPQPPPPTYDAPPKARAGFTRSPREDDVLVCPNCDSELGVGRDEEKRQVWVVKKCGHVSLAFNSGRPSTNPHIRSIAAHVQRTVHSRGARGHGQPALRPSRHVKWRIASRKRVTRQPCSKSTCDFLLSRFIIKMMISNVCCIAYGVLRGLLPCPEIPVNTNG